MYKCKKDVDKYVETLVTKVTNKEFNSRACSVARMYFDVGDYTSCQKYVEKYISQKDNNPSAYKLLGQTLQRLGEKDKAVEQFKISLNLDPKQTSLILDICELLADMEVMSDVGQAKYWCEKAEAMYPRHPITFRLRERLVTAVNPDPQALTDLFTAELATHPKDAALHARLLRHYLQNNKYEEAFEHSCHVEFGEAHFLNNYAWYETLLEVIKHQPSNVNNWQYQLLLLTIHERLCTLSLSETPSGISKGLAESSVILHHYDQAIHVVAKAGYSAGFPEFHAGLLQHHRGQFMFHAAVYLLKKAKKDQISWRVATTTAAPLMLMSWHTVPLDIKVNWLTTAPEEQRVSVQRWYVDGSYRCSQSGHYLLANLHDKTHSFLDEVSQQTSGSHWRDKLYEKIFTNPEQIKNTSDFVSKSSIGPTLRLPKSFEVEAYDTDAQKYCPTSLHHFIWILMNYKKFSNFKCELFNMLTIETKNYLNCGPETLTKMDILAFLYSATLTAQQNATRHVYNTMGKPTKLPASITDLHCTLMQMKWWDCAYKFTHKELGTELTDIRTTLSRGIEVVRCVDNHGMDPELLCKLGRIFQECAASSTSVDEKNSYSNRAGLYYNCAIPQLEKIKNKLLVKVPEKRMFDYVHKDLSSKDLNSLIEECKLFLGISFINDNEYDKAIDMLSNLKTPVAMFHLSDAYTKLALEEYNLSNDVLTSETKLRLVSLLSRAKNIAYKTLERFKDCPVEGKTNVYAITQDIIEQIEACLRKVEPDVSNDTDEKYYSDENISSGSDNISLRKVRNVSSTPKHRFSGNVTNYRSALDSQLFDNTRLDQKYLERIESQIKNINKKEASVNMCIEQIKSWMEEILKSHVSIINSKIDNMFDQFLLLKLSVEEVKEQVGECRCDVTGLKKDMTDINKKIKKGKKTSSDQGIEDCDLYNIENEYRNTENVPPTFVPQMPFAAAQMMPPFNQRIIPPFPIPPSPYQLYGQNLYNFYSQYSQLAQAPPLPGAPPIFDPSRPPVNYPGVYPIPEQMYAEMVHLIPNAVPPVPATLAPPTTTVSAVKTVPATTVTTKQRQLPVNVVITSSDPLPTFTTITTPVLSVTIPPEHIKGTPHNYQIQMPPSSEPQTPATYTSFPSWNKPNVNTTQSGISTVPKVSTTVDNAHASLFNTNKTSGLFDTSLTNVGNISGTSLNGSYNKSRTLSEKSNTSVENYDPCPDFKPIVPLPAEVKVTTGEEDEIPIFSARAKLFRFSDKQWKERGLGEMKLLKHKKTGRVRVLMRREQVHKVCANHLITPEIEIQPMKNETKAYFWVANDFADENVVLEKFCIRFKTADIAKQFYEAFEKSRKEALTTSPLIKKGEVKSGSISVPEPNNTSTPKTVAPTKTIVGGFTFSTTPTFKNVNDKENEKVESTQPKTATVKANPFSNITLKSNATTPFSNLFASNENNAISNSAESTNKLNTSDIVEEFEPSVEFKPVVPLPALVDQKTGEEDEIILFEHRAKLLRFDVTTKEWKERGLGNIKLLAHKENNQKVRLLMRREQVMKVCCNHSITRDMNFQKMPNNDKAITWCARDFSEGELVPETLCLRFKTAQTLNAFMESVKAAQTKMMDDSKAAKEEQNAAKQTNQIGFGDRFKMKPGSWYCESCYTNNLDNFLKCACCEQPKPSVNKETNKSTPSAPSSGWGDQFKPKPGTWECKECLVRNENTAEYCAVCTNPRDPAAVTNKEVKEVSQSVPTFNFGVPPQAFNPSSWGDKFKPKPGSWECQQCFVRNDESADQCTACNNSKDPTKKIFAGSYTFGIPPNQTAPIKTNATVTYDGVGTRQFTFGIITDSMTSSKPTGGFSFGTVNSTSDKTVPPGPINFSIKKTEEPIVATPTKPALLPTPQKEPVTTTPFGTKGSSTFDFVFKPKSPPKGKSPMKSPKSEKGDESDGNEYVSEDEGHHIHFSPIIPMPEKVEVVTGEENENELYSHRAKLYRFCDLEWKERGRGNVKILSHKDTGKVRVVMRREQVHKICLNHALIPEVKYTPKDERTWLFVANDYSEGELALQRFCLRFANKEIATEFIDAINKARDGKQVLSTNTDGDDIVFVTEIQASEEDKKKAKELMLPENFFTYKNKVACAGCRGCSGEGEEKSEGKQQDVSASTSSTTSTVAASITSEATSSPKSRTPLENVAQNKQTAINVISHTSNAPPSDKENIGTSANTGFSGIFGQKLTLASPHKEPEKPAVQFGQPESTVKSSVIAPPKLNTASETQSAEPKSIFSFSNNNNPQTTETKSIFGNLNANSLFGNTSSNGKPTFGFSNDSNKIEKDKPEVISIFGDAHQKPVNIFNSGGSIFGVSATANQNKSGSIFGNTGGSIFSNTLGNNQTNTEKSVFGSNTDQKSIWTFGNATASSPATTMATTNTVTADTKAEGAGEQKSAVPFALHNTLSFAALSSESGGEFNIQKQADFKWEGTGQQIFSSQQNAPKQRNESGVGAEVSGGEPEEEYDPHYEPIVPLPDKIVVTTGEEDEEKIFGERCKLYRYDEKSREWKERGVGEMKLLYHPHRDTYRLLLRREQVHKAVLNTLLFMDLQLRPMKNSDRAWTWVCRNFAETPEGEQETLAVRFKSLELANLFKDKVNDCVYKLQIAAAKSIREEKERLEKAGASGGKSELESATSSVFQLPSASRQTDKTEQNGDANKETEAASKPHVHFQEVVELEQPEDNAQYHDYEVDYNEEEDDTSQYFACEGIVSMIHNGKLNTWPDAQIQVLYDNNQYVSKIFITDSHTGEILTDMYIDGDIEFELDGATCVWSGMDYLTTEGIEKTITVHFPDTDTAIEFYDACETSRAGSYTE